MGAASMTVTSAATGMRAVAGLRASRILILPVACSIAASASEFSFAAMASMAFWAWSMASIASLSSVCRLAAELNAVSRCQAAPAVQRPVVVFEDQACSAVVVAAPWPPVLTTFR